eukprot:g7932.t1
MGNLCTTAQGADDRRRKPDSRRKGSGSSTTGFSPTEDLAYAPGEQPNGTAHHGGGASSSSSSAQIANGVRTGPVSASEVDVHAAGTALSAAGGGGSSLDRSRKRDGAERPSTAALSNGDPPLNRSRRGSGSAGSASAAPGVAAAAAAAEGGDGGSPGRGGVGGEAGGERESRRRRDSARGGKDGDERRRSSRRKSSRKEKDGSGAVGGGGEGRSSRGREKGSSAGGSSRRRDGDQSGRRPRTERTEKEIAERKEQRRRERAARASANGGDPEAEEARRERRERKERRKRKEAAAAAEAEAAAAAAAAAAAGGGAVGGVAAAAATAAAAEVGAEAAAAGDADSARSAGLEGSGDGRRDRKGSSGSSSKRKDSGRAGDGRYSGSGGGSRERGSTGAAGVMAGSGGSAAGTDHPEKKKRSSSLRKVGSGSAGRSSRSSGAGRTQLVTSVTSRDVREKYEIERSQLGHGHYGVVRRCWDKATREGFAIKTIKKSKVSRIESLRREIEILRCVDHPCIIKLYDVYEDDRFIHLVTELCTGGELFDRIIQKTESEEGHYSEKDAKVVVASILSGIEYCHNEHNICHRDLKPENFLFKRPDSDTEIKIIDFGLSRFEDMQSAMTTRVGTPYYIAPEVLSRKYDKACDLWSIGVITYILLAGYPPFYGESDQEIFASVRHGYFDFPSPEWDNISVEAKDFITQLLQKDPAARMSATQSINHSWFDTPSGGAIADATAAAAGGASESTPGGDHVNMQRINHRLRRFVRMSKLKKVALNVIAQQLTETEIGHLRGVFELLDRHDKGVIGPDELQEVVVQDGIENSEEDITLQNLVKIFGAEEHAREIMGDVNLSGEGAINYDEFKTMMMDMPLDGRDQMTPRTPRTPRFTLRA